jgi:hypothetical protein
MQSDIAFLHLFHLIMKLRINVIFEQIGVRKICFLVKHGANDADW